ncbi:MAG: Holliday junction branch migration DNA helicase RuvB [Acetomicrobium sp.]|jgi:Holliday junction DNA helicase RuvB|uniref:Holliday junction branch migration DNA helicase RuvB n=1 Tax=Acetomicrobium TaxID=49894 RepID=UPI00168DA3DC|nr:MULTISPECIES: Holliday junction branch migration DNA helicase RuvB [Acetomicrobium]MDI9377338.1 Holliday junction branch migration DNA helicase RuvB [Synergistota bacterium]NLI43578.1 Holliday junction branch migration DNA helicase RuvB [Synergistaceae bacterium]MDR9770882.1 Holliday junction branch migration DNA helicase RuvB [Acetomicrobium sp.]HOB10132.1 Holliday junction branch migration DNA helicase RuvB [Acetomicrobium sp.]HQA36815.1 Holliday junction branch migration DNA helicase Ruv
MKRNSARLVSEQPLSMEEDVFIRPQRLDEFIGQARVINKLSMFIKAAKARGEPLDHTLFCGPPGLGKTTLAGVVAHEMGGELKTTTGPAISRTGDLAAILSSLKPKDVFFIDEIHRLSPQVEEVLYSAMEDFFLNIIIGKGPMARSIRLTLPKFTLIGATTKPTLLSAPLRGRFGIIEQLEYYSVDELTEIVIRGASVLSIAIEEREAALEIAKRSRGTPRVALRLLKRVRDIAEAQKKEKVDLRIAKRALDILGIDDEGIDEQERRLLSVLIELFEGGPVGLSTLAAAMSEEERTIEEIYEPFLLRNGLLERTKVGRIATKKAYERLGLPYFKGAREGEENLRLF